MQRCAITPYEGDRPYIFISYAHKDAGQVYPVIEALERQGYRVWHDDGVVPGSEWPENIAQHLNGCHLTLAFISPNAVASDNCRREVTFALSKHKEFLAVILEPTEMSLGMELQLSAQQCIMKYNYTTQDSFLNKLRACPGMAPCRRPDAIDEPERDRSPLHVTEKPLDALKGAAKERNTPREIPHQQEGAQEKTGRRRRSALVLLRRVLVAAVCCAIAVALFTAAVRVRITPEKVVNRDATSLYLKDEYITANTVRQINKLTHLDFLQLDACSFEAGALDLLKPPAQLNNVHIENCSGVDSLDFLADLTELHRLTLTSSGITDSLLPETHMAELAFLDLSQNPELTSLAPFAKSVRLSDVDISDTGISSLEGLPSTQITALNFAGTAVSDVSPLAAMSSLRGIYGGETQVREIDALAGLTGLTTLDFSGCALSDMDCVFSSLRLETLDLSDNCLSNLSPFRDCTVLCHVDLAQNQLEDVSVLGNSAGMLKTLDLSGNPLLEDQLQFLRGSPNLTELYVDGVPLKTLDMLGNAAQLTALSAVGCGLTDISGLAQSTKLGSLRLTSNKIADISPLGNLAKDYIALDLGDNPIQDASKLPQIWYSALSLLNDELDLSTAASLQGSTLALKYSQSLLNGALGDASNWTAYYIAGCPNDARVALEGALGAYRVHYLDPGAEDSIGQLERAGLLFVPAP